MILHFHCTLFVQWVNLRKPKWFNLQTNFMGNFIRGTSGNLKSPTVEENPPSPPSLCLAAAKAIFAFEANEQDCCAYHTNHVITVNNTHYNMASWINTDLLPVLSCSSSLRMDFPSMSGGVSNPAMWRIVGARSMFSTRWGFLKRNMHVMYM